MKELTFEQVRPLLRGAWQVRQIEEGIWPMRFGDKALAYFDQKEGKYIRARCPAGVRISMVTDSPTVSLTAGIGGAARPEVCFDVYADGVMVASRFWADPPGEVRLDVDLPGAADRLDIYLPHCRVAYLRSLAVADGAMVRPADPADRLLLALGDSITQGMHSLHPSLIFPAVAARRLGMDFYSAGVGGQRWEVETLGDAPLCRPDVVTIALGCNDWSGGFAPENAAVYLRKFRQLYGRVPTAVLLPLWRRDAEPPDAEPKPNAKGMTLAQYRRGLADVVKEFDVTVLPAEKLLPVCDDMLYDIAHPSTAGHVVYGNNVAELLRPLRKG